METQKENLPEVEATDEDVPSDFFDDFNKDEFMEGLSVIDSWKEDAVKKHVPRIDAEAVESVKDLRELIRDGKEDGDRPAGEDRHRSSSQTRLDDYIKPGSRRDPSKVNAAIRRDKEVKVKEYLAKHLESTEDLRPPGTELDDFFDEGKAKETKSEQKPLKHETRKHRESPSGLESRKHRESPSGLESRKHRESPSGLESRKHRESPSGQHSKYSTSRRRSPARRRNSPRRSPRRDHDRSPYRGYRIPNRYPSPRHHSPNRSRGSQYLENQNRSPLKMVSRSRRYSPVPLDHRSSYERRSRHRSPYEARLRMRSPLERDLRYRSPLNRRTRSRSLDRRPRSLDRRPSYDYLQDPMPPPGYGPGGPYQGGPGYGGPPIDEFSVMGPVPGSGPILGFAYPQGPPAYLPPVMSAPDPYNPYSGQEIPSVPGPQPVPAPMLPSAPVNVLPQAPPMVPPPQPMQPATNNYHTTQAVKPYDALAQLVAEGKLSKEDYLKLAPNKGKSARILHGVSSCLDNKARVDVLNRCNEALAKLSLLKVPNRLLMNTIIPGVEQKALTPKFCSPLKRQAPVEFMFTRGSGSAAARHNKQLLESIITTIGLDKTVLRPKKKPKKDTKDAAVQTTKPYCDVCEIRDSREFYDASTHIDHEDFSSSVHTQVLEQDLMNSGGLAGTGPMSIAHMTPAQLVSQLAARAKTLKQTDPMPPPALPPPQPNHYGRRPDYDYGGRGGPHFQNNYNNYNRY